MSLFIQGFTLNPYQENTWLIADDEGACAIIDPGCSTAQEQRLLLDYLDSQQWTPVLLLNTHGHIDHILGNAWAVKTFDIPFCTHPLVVDELAAAPAWGMVMGLKGEPSPAPTYFVEHGDVVQVGQETLEVLFTPGHAAGHISFYHRAGGHLFSGDVLFQQSIGRTDLPGGDYLTLMQSITEKVLPLGDEVIVYPGHGPTTTIGYERSSNSFLHEYLRS